MELLKTDRSSGYARIKIENTDDIWHLKDFIDEGDRLSAVTQRTKLDGREKKTLRLTLEVEKTEYQQDRLRVTGEMVEAGEEVEHGYHTFNLEPGKEFEIWGDFSDDEWSRLLELEKQEAYQVLFCLVEKGKADFYLVEESGISDLSKLSENIPGKLYGDQETGESFHSEVVTVLERSGAEVDNIILAGPGFEKEHVYEAVPEELKAKTLVQDTSVTGDTGLQEAIKRGALKNVVERSRIAEETAAFEEFLEELEKDGNADYGEPVLGLVEQGAVEKLLVTPEVFREQNDYVELVKQKGGEVQLIHTDHESGKRLENFGGIAAMLRYRA